MTVSRLWLQILQPTNDNLKALLLINMYMTFDPWQSKFQSKLLSPLLSPESRFCTVPM